MHKAPNPLHREDPFPKIPFSIDDELFIVPSVWEFIGWLVLGVSFVTLMFGFLGS